MAKLKGFLQGKAPFASGDTQENLVQKQRLKSSYFHIYNA